MSLEKVLLAGVALLVVAGIAVFGNSLIDNTKEMSGVTQQQQETLQGGAEGFTFGG